MGFFVELIITHFFYVILPAGMECGHRDPQIHQQIEDFRGSVSIKARRA